jgi:hypothetical protein
MTNLPQLSRSRTSGASLDQAASVDPRGRSRSSA